MATEAPTPSAATPADGDRVVALLDAITTTIVESTCFRTVAVNLRRPEWDDYVVAAVRGSDGTRAALLGSTCTDAEWEPLLRAEFEREGAYFVPHRRHPDGAPPTVPDVDVRARDHAWHPGDALFVPLRDDDGRLLGVLAVDDPESGLRPTDDEIRSLAALAGHAAMSVAAAQAAVQERRHQVALAQLFRVSATLNESDSVDEVLQAVCDAIHEALGFQLVVIETVEHEIDRYRARASAGRNSDPSVLQLEVPIERIRRLYDPAYEIEGCFLLPGDAAFARVGDGVATYASQLNGRGPLAWDRHWLIVPLYDGSGQEIGFIWADDPLDRLLPSSERLQALRLFADTAQRALTSARQLDGLREAEERQRAVVQLSPTGIVLLDAEGRVRDWNDAARAVFGYRDDEVIGHRPPWLLEPEGFAERFARHLASGEVDDREFTDVRADGCHVQVRTTSTPLRDGDGVPTGVVATVSDVTGDRLAQQELERRKGEVEALYETTLALIDRLDLESVLHTIVARAAKLVDGDGGFLYLVDEDADVARPAVATGMFAGRVTRAIEPGEGIGGHVWESGETLVVDDYARWDGRLPGFDDETGSAIAGVPIRAGTKTVGAIGVGLTGSGRTFTAAERGLLTRFSHLASLAIAKARLYQEAKHEVEERRRAERRLERQNAELEMLYETGLQLIDRIDAPTVLATLVERARELTGSDGAFLYLVDRQVDALRPTVTLGTFVDGTKLLRAGEGISGRVWETGEPLAVPDYRAWTERSGGYERASCTSFTAVPIGGRDGVVGVLGVGYTDREHDLDVRTTQLRRFAQLASLALQNAQLYEALRRSEQLYRKVVDNASDLISLTDPAGTVVFASPSHERVLGYRTDKLLGGPLFELVHEDDVPLVARAIAHGAPAPPVRVRHRDGHHVFLEGTPVPLVGDDGQPEGVLIISRDVTERVRAEEERAGLEEQLRQSQKMEAIGRLAGGVAHDFNNLLTAIGGYAELAVGQVAEASPAQHSLSEIQRASDRAAGLTRQLLAYSRKQVLQPKVVDVNEIVAGMHEILARLLGTHIALATDLDPGVGRTRVDPTQLEQVVMNLAINARDAMPKGGRLVLRTASAYLDGDDYLLLEVSDTGHGMPSETLERAFEPFFTTKALGEGTGLGLSTVYGIVKQTGGHVEAESTPDDGTTVRVYLPRVPDAVEEQADGHAKPSQAGSGTVLLVEDEELVRDLVRELLAAGGYDVVCAANGPEALALAAAHPGKIDALVTDVVMPGMSGPQVAARLLEEHEGLRVLFTSGYAENAIATHGELTPGAAFLGKPFTARELAERLERLLATAA